MKLRLQAKCSDMCSVTVTNNDGQVEAQTEATYAPEINNLCSDDYIDLEIDLTTGVVQGLPDNMTILHAVKELEEKERQKREERIERMKRSDELTPPFKFNRYG